MLVLLFSVSNFIITSAYIFQYSYFMRVLVCIKLWNGRRKDFEFKTTAEMIQKVSFNFSIISKPPL